MFPKELLDKLSFPYIHAPITEKHLWVFTPFKPKSLSSHLIGIA